MSGLGRPWKMPKKQSLQEVSRQFALSIPPPKTNEYKTILTLLDDAERWRNVGDKELEKKTWSLIAEKASLYSDGMRENYQSGSKLQTEIVKPVFPSDRITKGCEG